MPFGVMRGVKGCGGCGTSPRSFPPVQAAPRSYRRATTAVLAVAGPPPAGASRPPATLGHLALVVGVFLLAAGELRQPLLDFLGDRFGVLLGSRIQAGGVASGVLSEVGYGPSQALGHDVKDV